MAEERLAAWRHMQAEVVHSVPTSGARTGAAAVLNPTLGSSVPRQEALRFAQAPASPLSAFERSLQHKESPLAIFQEVYGENAPPAVQLQRPNPPTMGTRSAFTSLYCSHACTAPMLQ